MFKNEIFIFLIRIFSFALNVSAGFFCLTLIVSFVPSFNGHQEIFASFAICLICFGINHFSENLIEKIKEENDF